MGKSNPAKQARKVVTSLGVRPNRIKSSPADDHLYTGGKRERLEKWSCFLEKRQVQGLRVLSLKTGIPQSSLVRMAVDSTLRKYRDVVKFTPGNTGRLLRLLANKKTAFDLATMAGVSPEEFIMQTLTRMEEQIPNTLLERVQAKIQQRLKDKEEYERAKAEGRLVGGRLVKINFPKEPEPPLLDETDIEKFCDEIEEANKQDEPSPMSKEDLERYFAERENPEKS